MKNMKKLLGLSLLTLAGTMSLASCGSIFKGNEGMMISNITHTLDKDGNTVITINFTDEDLEPVTFTIPKGEQGDTGMSGVDIEDVTWAPLEDGTGLEVTFSFTDEEIPDKVIEIPYATGIENIEATTDPDTGVTTVTINTTDGKQTSFTLNPAIGIADVQTSVDEESNAVIITITYTGGKEPTTITIPYKNGEDGKDGKGISFITGTVVGDQYYIDIYYDDDEGTRWTAYLHLASAKYRHDESGHDGCDDALFGSYARRYAEGDGERQGYNAYYYSGHDVCHKRLAVIVLQRRQQTRPECERFHLS